MNACIGRWVGGFVLSFAIAAAACGGGGQNAGQAPGDGGKPSAAGTVQINGAGATFPYPIYSKWFSEYNKPHPNVQINYQSVGSGGGIRQLTNETVFFGATDGPMTSEQMQGAPGKIGHLPTDLGGVAPV